MKKIIAVVVAVVVIWVGLKMIGVNLSLSSSPSKDDASEKKKVTPDNIIGEYMPGVSFPEGADEVHIDVWNGDRISYWIVAKLPKEDFYHLVEQLRLTKKPDLLELWPKAFDLEQPRIAEFWDMTSQDNEDTYYGEHPEVEASAAAKYENGKTYLRTIATYIVVEDEDGKYRYDGIKKRQE